MAFSKIILNGTTLIDLTGDTVATDNLISPNTAHNNAGQAIVGTASGGSAPTLQTKTVTYTPTESQQTATITADSGYDGLEEVDVTVGAISSNYVGSGITRRSSSDLTASGATVTVPSGYYASQATKNVNTMSLPTGASTSASTGHTLQASIPRHSGTRYLNISSGYNSSDVYYELVGTPNGTEGTPTATKGTVSNHSVSVTPSVTNTEGYITGSTKTGTAVTVSASELVSGTLSLSDNGTSDCTNYASVSVSIPFVTYYTGTGNPSSSQGSNGDIYLKVVS